MKRFLEWIEEALVAITFTEVGEYAVAQEFLSNPPASTWTRTQSEIHLAPHKPLVSEGNS